MIKEIEINGCVTVPNDLTHDEFLDKFINFVVANEWKFGGVTKELIGGEYVDEN